MPSGWKTWVRRLLRIRSMPAASTQAEAPHGHGRLAEALRHLLGEALHGDPQVDRRPPEATPVLPPIRRSRLAPMPASKAARTAMGSQ